MTTAEFIIAPFYRIDNQMEAAFDRAAPKFLLTSLLAFPYALRRSLEKEPAVPPVGRTNWKMINHATCEMTLPPAEPTAMTTSASSPKISPKIIVVNRCKTMTYPQLPPLNFSGR